LKQTLPAQAVHNRREETLQVPITVPNYKPYQKGDETQEQYHETLKPQPTVQQKPNSSNTKMKPLLSCHSHVL